MPPLARIHIRMSRAALWSRRLGALAVPVLALAAAGHRAGVIGTEALLPVLVLGFALAVASLGTGIAAFADIWENGSDGMRNAVIGIIYASLVYPRLTDVSTDLLDVPEFTASATARPVSVDDVVQVEAYPEISARFYPVSLEEVYTAVKIAIDERGWTITDDPGLLEVLVSSEPPLAENGTPPTPAAPAAGAAEPAAEPAPEEPRPPVAIEAVARTGLFGFPDDVVVRLQETADGTRVDLRSASRIGTHDLGQNARRISGFLAELDAVLQGMADAAAGPLVDQPPAPPPPRPPRPPGL